VKVERNPTGSEERYLSALNSCFGNWGDETGWDWTFERPISGRKADRMVLTDDQGRWLAGSAITWRNLAFSSGGHMPVGIMTGSWVMPEAREKGCFSRIIKESLKWVREQEGGLLLAFVTSVNASRRRLEAAGSSMLATRYVTSDENTPEVKNEAELRLVEKPSEGLIASLAQRSMSMSSARPHFLLNHEEWRGQFIDRPRPSLVLESEEMGHAVVEDTGATIRLLTAIPWSGTDQASVIEAVLGYAQAHNKSFFTFISDPPQYRKILEQLGLVGAEGFLTALTADADVLALNIRATTKPLSSDGFVGNPAVALRRPAIQDGDRM
jgi:hypothetical protein